MTLPQYSPWVPTWPECIIDLPDYPVADVEWVLHLPAEPYEPPPAMVAAMAQIEAHEKALAIQTRHAAGLDALAAGALKVQPTAPRGRSGPKVDTLVAMAAGYALCLRDQGRDTGRLPSRPSAVDEAIQELDRDGKGGLRPSTVERHLEQFEQAFR
jgi:hypothetical protein